MKPRRFLWSSLIFCAIACNSIVTQAKTVNADREIAARYAPVFYQALGDKPRSDYFTNFDFDGDWRGDNNWEHADDARFPLRAYIYFAVSETKTHYFILYAVFHPRDYKGGETKGRILSEIIGEGAKRGEKYDPTGWVEEATIAHENDMEGVLVVVEKNKNGLKDAAVSFVETLHHNNFLLYAAGEGNGFGSFIRKGDRPVLYVEPKGHGIEAYSDTQQTSRKEFLTYIYKSKAEDPEKQKDSAVGYDLLPLQILWAKARRTLGNITYGNSFDYREITLRVAPLKGGTVQRKIKVGKIGAAFLGNVGGHNMAKPPWAWFDKDRRGDALGLWFFDPATTIKRDFKLDESFSTAYTRLPFWATN